MDVSEGSPVYPAIERTQATQDQPRSEFAKTDAIMEPATTALVDQYLEAGCEPLDVINSLVSSYDGVAAMANAVDHDIMRAYGVTDQSAILETLSRKIVKGFDATRADGEFSKEQQLPDYILHMIPHQFWRKTIYQLSEQHPKSNMLSAAIQKIADGGFQAELAALNSATLHTHVFLMLLVESFENVAPANDEALKTRMCELIKAVCGSEQTYFVAQYLLAAVRQRLGPQAIGLRRVEEELESFMLDTYDRPQLAIHMRLMLEGYAVGGDDAVANAFASIIQSSYASPGDTVALYKHYHGALADGSTMLSAQMLRSERVLMPIVDQAFGHLWDAAPRSPRTDLMDKYIWLIAYAMLGIDGQPESVEQSKLRQLIAQMKEAREALPVRPIQTTFNQIIHKVIEWTRIPILARVVLLWVQDVISYNNFTYYDTYFHSSEVPVPLLLLEEIAFCQPLLKPLVFAVYKGSFESKVPGFIPEKQIRLQKAVINRIAALVQLGYALPILHYFISQADSMDQSVLAYFIFRNLAQFEAPYPESFYQPMLQLIERAIGGIETMKEKELMVVRGFLACIDDEDGGAKRMLMLLPKEPTPPPLSASAR
ncbi:hypothetical protein H4R26_004408 [Coemansia thaxteri]|uniref:TH1 protein n=1 Tax=Coemansia thaxteri TaxID=2663907 RepID=A0A9W8BG77_9FUNG|nr:hypothetical protein H4R26_004408 [Coemansia thaxteri]